jgi:hypothetical protein
MMPGTIDTAVSTPKKILMVVANPGTSELTGWPIGFRVSEFLDPPSSAGGRPRAAPRRRSSSELCALGDLCGMSAPFPHDTSRATLAEIPAPLGYGSIVPRPSV